jgi:hypothetical protein
MFFLKYLINVGEEKIMSGIHFEMSQRPNVWFQAEKFAFDTDASVLPNGRAISFTNGSCFLYRKFNADRMIFQGLMNGGQIITTLKVKYENQDKGFLYIFQDVYITQIQDQILGSDELMEILFLDYKSVNFVFVK